MMVFAGHGSPGSPISQSSPGISSDVPTIVHDLIRDMKALQESLRLWSLAQATQVDVSDRYVQFGVEFNAIARALEGYDISTSDLHSIPARLRSVLEDLLGEEPSPGVLDRYMPDVRRLLYELLLGLRSKQTAWRSASARPPTTGCRPSQRAK